SAPKAPLPCTRGRGVGVRGLPPAPEPPSPPTPLPRVQGRGEKSDKGRMLEGAWLYVWLGLAAFAAGCVNSIAGGGTLLTFPALLAVVSPVVANGTSTVALVPGSISAAWGFRRDLHTVRRWIPLLIVPSLVGGYVGSRLVTKLEERYFDALVPWLVL